MTLRKFITNEDAQVAAKAGGEGEPGAPEMARPEVESEMIEPSSGGGTTSAAKAFSGANLLDLGEKTSTLSNRPLDGLPLW